MDGHLGGGMPLQSGNKLAGQGGCSQVLHQDGICTQLVQPDEVLCQIKQLILPDQGVDGNVDFNPPEVGIVYGFRQVSVVEVCGELSCSESFAAQVHRIRTCCYGRVQGLWRAGGGEKFRQSYQCQSACLLFPGLISPLLTGKCGASMIISILFALPKEDEVVGGLFI